MAKTNLIGVSKIQLENYFALIGIEKYRANQVLNWIYKNRVYSIDLMTNLPGEVKKKLFDEYFISLPKLDIKQSSKDGTKKYLFTLEDGNKIETVLIPHEKNKKIIRKTLCISSQVGCSVKCIFCASGKNGLIRNLNTAELIGQILSVEEEEKKRVSNIVFMGMGEPLHNYSNVMEAVNILTSEECFYLSARKITISTCGIVPKIKELAEKKLSVVLAVSLHSPENKKRDYLVPINKKYPIEELIKACKYYIEKTKRKITFEYVIIEGINDSKEDAVKLSSLLKGLICNVNLIPINKIDEKFKPPQEEQVDLFKIILKKSGIECEKRIEKGSDIEAACGQLKGKNNTMSETER